MEADHELVVNVSPPLGSAPFTASGMDPEGIKDPRARKRYEDDIAANNLRWAQFNREKALQRLVDDGLRDVRMQIRNQGADPASRKRAVEVIDSIIKEEKLRARLVEE